MADEHDDELVDYEEASILGLMVNQISSNCLKFSNSFFPDHPGIYFNFGPPRVPTPLIRSFSGRRASVKRKKGRRQQGCEKVSDIIPNT